MENFYSKEHLELATRLKLEPDDPMVFITLENLKLGEKVVSLEQAFGIWSKAIVNQSDQVAQQTRLIVEQNSAMQTTSKNSSDLSKTIEQFSKETSSYARGLQQLSTTTNSLEEVSTELLKSERSRDNHAQALSSQMSKLDAGILDNRGKICLKMESTKIVLSRSLDAIIRNSIYSLGLNIFVAVLALLGGVGAFFAGDHKGYLRGVRAGREQISVRFDGDQNLDFWRSLRSHNHERMEQCISAIH